LIDAGIARVVYAVTDPNPIASGGAERLRAAGIDVTGGVAEAAARQLARYFLHHVETRQPWVIAKSASSLDGRVATRTGHSQWITGDDARRAGHRLRQATDAILVGIETVLADDPARVTTFKR
jgi:diaminohydroxyphosphoribosylaminopyrimidine deaminase/5-amino-6-(5-phosphoribosylamino)uracil reductase